MITSRSPYYFWRDEDISALVEDKNRLLSICKACLRTFRDGSPMKGSSAHMRIAELEETIRIVEERSPEC